MVVKCAFDATSVGRLMAGAGSERAYARLERHLDDGCRACERIVRERPSPPIAPGLIEALARSEVRDTSADFGALRGAPTLRPAMPFALPVSRLLRVRGDRPMEDVESIEEVSRTPDGVRWRHVVPGHGLELEVSAHPDGHWELELKTGSLLRIDLVLPTSRRKPGRSEKGASKSATGVELLAEMTIRSGLAGFTLRSEVFHELHFLIAEDTLFRARLGLIDGLARYEKSS